MLKSQDFDDEPQVQDEVELKWVDVVETGGRMTMAELTKDTIARKTIEEYKLFQMADLRCYRRPEGFVEPAQIIDVVTVEWPLSFMPMARRCYMMLSTSLNFMFEVISLCLEF